MGHADFYSQLTSERRETRLRYGQPYVLWVLPSGKRNEVLDCFVGALAVRRALPHRLEAALEYSNRGTDDQGDGIWPKAGGRAVSGDTEAAQEHRELVGEVTSKAIRAAGMSWYRAQDHGRILEIMEDADKLPATYDQWPRGR